MQAKQLRLERSSDGRFGHGSIGHCGIPHNPGHVSIARIGPRATCPGSTHAPRPAVFLYRWRRRSPLGTHARCRTVAPLAQTVGTHPLAAAVHRAAGQPDPTPRMGLGPRTRPAHRLHTSGRAPRSRRRPDVTFWPTQRRPASKTGVALGRMGRRAPAAHPTNTRSMVHTLPPGNWRASRQLVAARPTEI
jgi:hypothetical protein